MSNEDKYKKSIKGLLLYLFYETTDGDRVGEILNLDKEESKKASDIYDQLCDEFEQDVTMTHEEFKALHEKYVEKIINELFS